MNLVKQWVSSNRMSAERFERIQRKMIREPLTTVELSAYKDDAPEVVMLTPRLYNTLVTYAEIGQELSEGEPFAVLKIENRKLRSLLDGVIRELRELRGDDYKLSNELWTTIRRSVVEAIEDKRRLFPLVE